MPYIQELLWDKGNLDHIEDNRVHVHEIEEAIFNAENHSFKKGHKAFIIGKSDGGRFITIVLEDKGRGSWRPVTARTSDEKEVKLARRQLSLRGRR